MSRAYSALFVFALAASGCELGEVSESDLELESTEQESQTCQVQVTASHAGDHGTTSAMARDGNGNTYFESVHDNWQYLQVDLGCVGSFKGLRRKMTRNGIETWGNRALQGEGVSYSLDGQTWTALTGQNATGWQGYVNYVAHAWHTLPYGWSNFLRPSSPVQARYVRFNWDGDGDALNEVEIDHVPNPPPVMCGPQTVTANQMGDHGTVAAATRDGNTGTFFESVHDNWQHVQIDLGCAKSFKGLRRMMTRNGSETWGTRFMQGEGVSYSLDGQTWTSLTGQSATGWQGYVNYSPAAWHTLPYGWSNYLRPNSPVTARYIRFNWDGDGDALNEVEIDAVTVQTPPPPPPPPVCGPQTVSANQPGDGGTVAASTRDGNAGTFFESTFDNWQHVQIDLGCQKSFKGLRRMMTRNGIETWGTRFMQGEGVSYSLDGQTWTSLTGQSANGWQGYVNYVAHAWHSLPYGWSAYLRPASPVMARYIRFNWDGDSDALNEVELDIQ